MKIESKYNIGDRVKYKYSKYIEHRHICDFCGGAGEVENVNHVVVDCPACDGLGYIYEESLELVDVIRTIRQILVTDKGIEYIFNSYYASVPENNIVEVVVPN